MPYPSSHQRQEPVRLGDHRPHARVQPDADQRDGVRDHLHRLPEQLRRPEPGSREARVGYPYQGVFGDSPQQIPSLVSDGLGRYRAVYSSTPAGSTRSFSRRRGRSRPRTTRPRLRGAHTLKAGFYFEHVTNAQPGSGNSNGDDRQLGIRGQQRPATRSPTSCSAASSTTRSSRRTRCTTSGSTSTRASSQDSWKIRPNLTLDFGLRLSYDGYWYDRAGNGIVAFDFNRYDPAAPASSFPGVVYHKIDSERAAVGRDGHTVLHRSARWRRVGHEGQGVDGAARRFRRLPLPRHAAAVRRHARSRHRRARLQLRRAGLSQALPVSKAWARATSCSAAPRSISATTSSPSPTTGARRSTSGFPGR